MTAREIEASRDGGGLPELPELPEPAAWLVGNGPLGPYATRKTNPVGWAYVEPLHTQTQLLAYGEACRRMGKGDE